MASRKVALPCTSVFPVTPSPNNNRKGHHASAKNDEESRVKMTQYGPLKVSTHKLSSNSVIVPEEFTVKGATPSGKPRLYVCSVCTRAFARQEHLKRHQRSHTKEKPFACRICSRKFSRRDLLMRHSSKLHAGASNLVPRLRKKSNKFRKLSGGRRIGLSSEIQNATRKNYNKVFPSNENSFTASKNDEIGNAFITSDVGNVQRSGRQNENKFDMDALAKEFSSIMYPSLTFRSLLMRESAYTDSYKIQENNVNNNLSANMEYKETTDSLNPTVNNPLLFPTNNESYVRQRGVSFSAMGGESYVNADQEPMDSVEFSTPQLYPEDMDKLSLDDEILSTSKVENGVQINSDNQKIISEGYSFYDVPSNKGTLFTHVGEAYSPGSGRQSRLKSLTSTVLESVEETDQDTSEKDVKNSISPSLDTSVEKVKSWQKTLFNQDINFLETIADLNIAKPFDIPQGYSFYGDDQQNLRDSSLSSNNTTISPPLLQNAVNNSNLLDTLPGEVRSSKLSMENLALNNFASKGYSRAYLFGNTIRSCVFDTLSKYPFFGVPCPTIPKNDKLNMLVQQFTSRFLIHYPFIHPSILNEYSLMTTTMDMVDPTVIKDDLFVLNFKSSLVCLPLLVAAIGATVSNDNKDASNLYEAARRSIHVYLETHKELRKQSPHNSASETISGSSSHQNESSFSITSLSSSSPLWLVQALTLSVMYGLFADDSNSLNVVIRQVNALCSLVKTSGLNKVNFQLSDPAHLDEISYNNFIRYESTIRTVHTITHITSLLSALYNICPALRTDDIFIDMPCASTLWNTKTLQDFNGILKDFDFQSANYKDVLSQLLLHGSNGNENTGFLDARNFMSNYHVGDYGLICLQNGLQQISYFKTWSDGSRIFNEHEVTSKLKSVFANWNLLISLFHFNGNSEIYNDSMMMNSYFSIKILGLVKLEQVKQQVWLRDFHTTNLLFCENLMYPKGAFDNSEFFQDAMLSVESTIQIFKILFFQGSTHFFESMNVVQCDTFKTDISSLADICGLGHDIDQLNMNIESKVLIDTQILYDAFLALCKFVTNFESHFKQTLQLHNLLPSESLSYCDFSIQNNGEGDDNILHLLPEQRELMMYGWYLKIFKVYLCLEHFLKINYDYQDFEGEFPSPVIHKILGERKGHDNSSLVIKEMKPIIGELIQFRLPCKLLKLGSFMFNFFYDKYSKFMIFKQLGESLFHLRIYLENQEIV